MFESTASCLIGPNSGSSSLFLRLRQAILKSQHFLVLMLDCRTAPLVRTRGHCTTENKSLIHSLNVLKQNNKLGISGFKHNIPKQMLLHRAAARWVEEEAAKGWTGGGMPSFVTWRAARSWHQAPAPCKGRYRHVRCISLRDLFHALISSAFNTTSLSPLETKVPTNKSFFTSSYTWFLGCHWLFF